MSKPTIPLGGAPSTPWRSANVTGLVLGTCRRFEWNFAHSLGLPRVERGLIPGTGAACAFELNPIQ